MLDWLQGAEKGLPFQRGPRLPHGFFPWGQWSSHLASYQLLPSLASTTKRHTEFCHLLHLPLQDCGCLLGLGQGALHNQLVMHLQDEAGALSLALRSASSTRIMASLMISAAVPWMGVFSATRSPKERRLKLLLLSSGRYRRRP